MVKFSIEKIFISWIYFLAESRTIMKKCPKYHRSEKYIRLCAAFIIIVL